MKQVESADDMCKPLKVDAVLDNEKIFSFAIIIPIFLISAVSYYVWNEVSMMTDVAKKVPYDNPIKKVWIEGPIFFTLLYLSVLFVGKKYMENKTEFKIKPYIFVYNLYQCIFNIVTVTLMLREVYTNQWFGGRLWGNYEQPGANGFRIEILVWIHYNNKFMELLDSLWMILRKKNNQLSFLHCYHHVLMMWVWFVVCRWQAGGDVWFGGCINSFIHIIMYGYYTLALLNIPCPWKKWITSAQMIQFVACLSHAIYSMVLGNVPAGLASIQVFVMLSMLVLFSQFYMKSYSSIKSKKHLT